MFRRFLITLLVAGLSQSVAVAAYAATGGVDAPVRVEQPGPIETPGPTGAVPDPNGNNETPQLPHGKAKLIRRGRHKGLAVAPADAPPEVKAIITYGNKIAKARYFYGGGHKRWRDRRGYDCSGSVSYPLHFAGFLKRPLDSTGFMSYGKAGQGEWVTIYAHGGHAYMTVAGLRFDTSGRKRTGSRWQRAKRSSRGYTVRHPRGL